MEERKTMKKVLAGLLAVLCVTTTAGLAVKAIKGKQPDSNITMESPNEAEQGGAVIGESKGHGIKLMSTRLKTSEYAAYGVSEQAENAYTLTATITPADAANKQVNWTVAFANPSHTWATGKTVTDYVTVTPTSDGALTAVVENKAAFGAQIVVKATSRENSAATASCTVEYEQKVTGYTFVLDGKTYSTTGTKTNTATPTFATTKSATATVTVNKSTVYTKTSTASANYFTVKPTAAFKTAVTNAGLTATSLKEYTGSASATLNNYFDKAWGEAVYGTNATNKNKFINALSGFSGNAYEIKIYTANGGTELATFNITLDTSVITGNKAVEGITIDETEIVF